VEPHSVVNLRATLSRLQGRREAALQRVESTRQEIKRLDAEVEVLDHVGVLFRGLIDQEVSVAVKMVERLLTEGLQTVFSDQDLAVRAEVGTSRGKVVVNLLTVQKHSDGTVTEGVASDAFGGAVTTVESALLRIVVMFRRGLRPFLLLDETFPAFDAAYVTNMGRFMSLLCQKMGIDALLVSHNPALVEAASRSYTIVKKRGAARFEPLR